MKKEKILKWIDALIDNHKQWKSLRILNDKIRITGDGDYIQIYKGIEYLSAAVGAELKEEFNRKRALPYYYFFKYKGVEFLQVEEERLEIR